MDEKITLYGYATSPYVNKVAAFLKYKRLGYTHVPVRPRTNEQIAFTGQTRVPVLQIDDEWRTESSAIGRWLDQRFGDYPLLPATDEARQTVTAIDNWISDVMIPARFREAVEWESTARALVNGWRLARIVHAGTPIPLRWRVLWPLGVKRARFIVDMVDQLDLSESLGDMRRRVLDELEAHLGDGPYLGNQLHPTMADLAAFTTLATGWMIGLAGPAHWRKRPILTAWMGRVQNHLPSNPLAVDQRHLVRALAV